MTWFRSCLLICVLCHAGFISGQTTMLLPDSSELVVRMMDEAAIQSYKADDAFDYGPRLQGETALGRWWRHLRQKITDWLFGEGGRTGEFFLITLGIAFLIFLGVFFRKSRLRGLFARPAEDNAVVRQVLEEDVEVASLSERISHSERTGDFRMALRWTYIALLIALDEDALLEVRGWKTNRDYREEMRSHAGADAFNALSEAFDYYWYGGHDLDASTYRNLLELVRHLQSKPVSA